MNIPVFQVDAFSDKIFGGNPAAVCPLPNWLDDDLLQSIAAENNLSETAFFVQEGDVFRLRWFTPTTEVDLCGHATLATAHILFNCLDYSGDRVEFETLSGQLSVTREGNLLAMDFPARPGKPVPTDANLADAIGAKVLESLVARDTVLVLESEAAVRTVEPDMTKIAAFDTFAFTICAPGESCDFVCRFFAPRQGIPEDPVTGSAFCTLAPYWAARLGKSRLNARQVSHRGGAVACEDKGDRVSVAGTAALFLTGEIHL
ncbi:MAG: isomerase [Candidatus Hydrogenedentota bacterium]